MKRRRLFFLTHASFCFLLIFLSIELAAQKSKSISIVVDESSTTVPLKPIWAFFGYDEPNYTYMRDGKKLLTEIAALSKVPVYVRAHNMLTTGNGEASLKWGSTNAYTEDSNGNPIYNWHITDSIFDTYIQRGMRPIAEIGFMPEALSIHPQPYRHHWRPGIPYDSVYTGWAYPPTDYNKWRTLVYEWVKHCVERYGEKEVETWYWEVWNEPNIGYWKGTPEEYFKLYDYAADAVKKACSRGRVGGPTSTGPSWDKAAIFFKDFLRHCAEGTNYVSGEKGAPLDYVSFHAKGSPKFIDGHVRMNMSPQLNDIIKGCEILSASAFHNLPIIIGECDPEGCAACGMATNPENAYRNGTMYSSYTAASFARIYDIAEKYHSNIEGAVSWSFEFENQPWFYGFRDLATNGIDKPVLNVFRMYGMMQGKRINIANEHTLSLDSIVQNSVRAQQRDIGTLATTDARSTCLMVWNYHDDDVAVSPQDITITFKNLAAENITAELYQIDSAHSNAYEVWKMMKSPQDVSPEQYKKLEQSGQLHKEIRAKDKKISAGNYSLKISLPGQAVYLIRVVKMSQ